MAKSGKPQSAKKRVKVKDLQAPKKEKELTAKEMKRAKGGIDISSLAGAAGLKTGATGLTTGADALAQQKAMSTLQKQVSKAAAAAQLQHNIAKGLIDKFPR